MQVSNSTLKRILPEFSTAQREELVRAAAETPEARGVEFNLAALPAWLADKLREAVSRIEVGA